MSGGSMNYVYQRLRDDASFRLNTPERRAFHDHLQLVAQALHDIEWVESCDYSPGDETAAIMACISKTDVLQAATLEAKRVSDELNALLARINGDA